MKISSVCDTKVGDRARLSSSHATPPRARSLLLLRKPDPTYLRTYHRRRRRRLSLFAFIQRQSYVRTRTQSYISQSLFINLLSYSTEPMFLLLNIKVSFFFSVRLILGTLNVSPLNVYIFFRVKTQIDRNWEGFFSVRTSYYKRFSLLALTGNILIFHFQAVEQML